MSMLQVKQSSTITWNLSGLGLRKNLRNTCDACDRPAMLHLCFTRKMVEVSFERINSWLLGTSKSTFRVQSRHGAA